MPALTANILWNKLETNESVTLEQQAATDCKSSRVANEATPSDNSATLDLKVEEVARWPGRARGESLMTMMESALVISPYQNGRSNGLSHSAVRPMTTSDGRTMDGRADPRARAALE